MIGIVGNGFVGNAVYQNFRDKTQCKVYDTDKNRSLNSLGEVINQEFIFVCLPTPMRYGGECDLSILDDFFEDSLSFKNVGHGRYFPIDEQSSPDEIMEYIIEKN